MYTITTNKNLKQIHKNNIQQLLMQQILHLNYVCTQFRMTDRFNGVLNDICEDSMQPMKRQTFFTENRTVATLLFPLCRMLKDHSALNLMFLVSQARFLTCWLFRLN